MSEEPELPTPPQSRFRFGLPQLFYITALVATGLVLSLHTVWISLLVLLFWWAVYRSADPRRALRLLLFPLLLLILISLMLPVVQISPEAPPGVITSNNMRQVMLASLNYESANGRFPSDRIVTLKDGTELRHSWRIELLPYLEERALYGQYDFNEPWDGPNNSKLLSQMPRLFSSPLHGYGDRPAIAVGHTSYKLVNGPGTAFEAGKRITSHDVADGPSETIGLIEDFNNPVNWMEPGDFTAEAAAKAMNSLTKEKCVYVDDNFFVRSYFGYTCAMLDGSSYCIAPQPVQPLPPGAFLIADGDVFDASVHGWPMHEVKHHVYIALVIYVLLLLFPAIYLRQPNRSRPT